MAKTRFSFSMGLLLVHAGGLLLLLLFALLFYIFAIDDALDRHDALGLEKLELVRSLEALPELQGKLAQAEQMLPAHGDMMKVLVPKSLRGSFAFSEFKDRLISEAKRLELNLELIQPGEVSELAVAGCMELPVLIRGTGLFGVCRDFVLVVLAQDENAPRVRMLRVQPQEKSNLCLLEMRVVLRAALEKGEDVRGS